MTTIFGPSSLREAVRLPFFLCFFWRISASSLLRIRMSVNFRMFDRLIFFIRYSLGLNASFVPFLFNFSANFS